MPVRFVDVDDKVPCPYCRKDIKPFTKRYEDELRLICPICNLTIEVKKFARK